MTGSTLIREIIESQPHVENERLATRQERLAHIGQGERIFEPVPMPAVFEPSAEFEEAQRRIHKNRPEQVYDLTTTDVIRDSINRIDQAYEEEELIAEVKRRRRRIGALAFFGATFGTAILAASTYLQMRGR